MIIYGVVANISVGTLFMAGFLLGFVGSAILLLTAWLITRKENFPIMEHNYSLRDVLRIVKKNIFALITPVIILGGIYSGSFTAVTVFYAPFAK
ncbi:MAG: TRAP transporter large permease subunit [Brevinema sp.]